MFSFADDHSISTDFSDCDGKVVNYYVSKIISGGSVEAVSYTHLTLPTT